MADYAPNATARLKVKYRVGNRNHNFTWRLPRNTDADAAGDYVDKVNTFLTNAEPVLWSDFTLLGGDFAPADSEVFLPIGGFDTITGATASAGRTAGNNSVFLQFIGRGALGAKGSFYLYGASFDPFLSYAGDYRITNSENTTVSALTGTLSEVAPNLVAIDNSTMTWYGYVNIKANDHWVHRSRTGA